jgi:hypothetical protein
MILFAGQEVMQRQDRSCGTSEFRAPDHASYPAVAPCAQRIWVNYGLTIPQVAEVYGVAVGVIERIFRQS